MSPSAFHRLFPAVVALVPLLYPVVGITLRSHADTDLSNSTDPKAAKFQSSGTEEAARQLLSPRANFAERKSCQDHGSGKMQCFPDIMFVGQSKAGTTSISMYLIQHPKVIAQSLDNSGLPDGIKVGNKVLAYEVHVFDRHFQREKAMLQAHWNSCPSIDTQDVNNTLQLHYTPNYMYFPDAPFHIKRLYPNARSIKYIMMLREPTKRTVSSWQFHRQLTMEMRSFKRAMRQGMQQRRALESCYNKELLKSNTSAKFVTDLQPGLMHHVVNTCFWDRLDTHDTTLPMELPITLMHGHVDKSVYVDQIRRWHALLGRENFFVFSLEEWIKDQNKVFKDMLDFVGLEAVGPNGFHSQEELDNVLKVRYNEDNSKGRAPPVDQEVVEELNEFFKPYDEELFELLGHRLW